MKKRSIYETAIPLKLVDDLSPRDKRALKTMNNIIVKKYNGQKVNITDASELHDWIQEYREEGHVL